MHNNDRMDMRLRDAGLRPTRQRLMLGSLLWEREDDHHVTAESLHQQAQQADMSVSLATVYNTLHQFTDAGLLREVVIDAGKSYFDTNTLPHHHFLCEATGELVDIPADKVDISAIPTPPEGSEISGVDVVIRLRPTKGTRH